MALRLVNVCANVTVGNVELYIDKVDAEKKTINEAASPHAQ